MKETIKAMINEQILQLKWAVKYMDDSSSNKYALSNAEHIVNRSSDSLAGIKQEIFNMRKYKG